MKPLLLIFKKDLRQHYALIALWVLLLLCRVGCLTNESLTSDIHPLVWNLMTYLEQGILVLYVGICMLIGYRDSPFNKEHFIATRPVPLRALLGAKFLFVGLIFSGMLLAEYVIANAWGLSSWSRGANLLLYLFIGWSMLLFASLWSSPLTFGRGCLLCFVACFGGLFIFAKLDDHYDLIKSEPNFTVLSLSAFVSLCLIFWIAKKLQRPAHPVVLLLFVTATCASLALCCQMPPAQVIAPSGSVKRAYVKPVEDSFNVYGADQGYTSYLRVANVGETWIRPNFSVTPLAKSIRIHHEGNEVFHQNREWDADDRGMPIIRGREDQYPLTSYLRPEQIQYVDRQYAKDYFAAPADKSAYLGAMKLPSSITSGELDYQFEMSYQLWEFQKTGSLPLQIGTSVIANGSEFTLVQIDLDQLLNSGRGKVWLRQRASQVPMMAEFESQNQSMAYVINSDTSAVTSIDFSQYTKVYNTGTLAPLSTSIIQLDIYLDNNVPYDERVLPLDLKIDLYQWVYLGVEDLGPIEIHKSMADLFKQKSKAAKATRTRTYPVLHSSQYWK